MTARQPEPCLAASDWAQAICRSPIACAGWGYCRERNAGRLPDAATQAAWRRQAEQRSEKT